MARVHVICCQKGGVGKTTLTVNLGAVTSEARGGTSEESPVLVVGTDPQRSMDWWANRVGKDIPFGYREIRDRRQLGTLRDITDYDDVFVDTPGSLEKQDILQAVLEQADDAIVPITPQPLTFPAVDTTVRILPRNLPYKVVVTLWDPRDGESGLDETREFVRAKGWPLARTVVRRYKVHERAAADSKVCTQYPKNRTSMEAREDFYRLALELGYGGGGR